MKVPALAARAPLGATKEATGTGEARIALMISRIALSRPPGVSMRSTTSWVPSVAARSIERRTKSAVAGPIAPSSGTTATGAARRPLAQHSIAASRSRMSRLIYPIDPTRCEAYGGRTSRRAVSPAGHPPGSHP